VSSRVGFGGKSFAGSVSVMAEADYSNCPSCPEIKKKIDRIDLACQFSPLVIIITGFTDIILNYLGKSPNRKTNNYPMFSWRNF
jgi:hypothetical protein